MLYQILLPISIVGKHQQEFFHLWNYFFTAVFSRLWLIVYYSRAVMFKEECRNHVKYFDILPLDGSDPHGTLHAEYPAFSL